MSGLALPALACDCHVHVIGPQQSHAMVDDRHYTPATASHAELLRHMQSCAIERVVIVQPSVYGSDNRCMLESQQLLVSAGRGVAVLEESASPQALAALDDAGIRGLRINFESAALCDVAAVSRRLQYWASRIASLGWHLQLYASLDTIAAAAPCIAKLEVPVVLDHFAMAHAPVDPTDARLQAVLALLQSGQAYVKLSAPYRIQGSSQPAVNDVSQLAAMLLEANDQRVLWGSDWPHTQRDPGKTPLAVSGYRDVGADMLLKGVRAWLPSPQRRHQVLVENPARLYRF